MNKNTKLIIGAVVILGIALIAIFFVRPMLQNRTVSTVVNEKIERPELNIAFTFPSGEDAYTYIEPMKVEGENKPVGAFIMMESKAYEVMQDPSFVGETPPSMSIFVFDEVEATSTVSSSTESIDRMTKLRNWAMENTSLTSYNLALSAPEEVEIDGVKALHYKADGVYLQDVYVAFYSNKFYLIVGQHNGEEDSQHGVFQELIRSVTFL